MPQQFQGKPKIKVLVTAFARQMQEILKVLKEINAESDLDTAMGQNLDYVGTIIPLTRKEAGEMEGEENLEPVISDERYRQLLRYQLLRNTNEGTYQDMMAGLELIYGNVPITYSEVKNHPATLHLTVPKVSLEEEFLRINRKLVIRPSGVGFYYTAVFYEKLPLSFLEMVDLPKILLRMAITFWGCRVLDGTWLLDGSYRLDAVRQPFPMRIVFKGMQTWIQEYYRVFLKIHGILLWEGMIKNVRNVIHIKLPFWNIPLLDGMWQLDGSVLFNAVRQAFPMRILLKGMLAVEREIMDSVGMKLQTLVRNKERLFLSCHTLSMMLAVKLEQKGRVVISGNGCKQKEMVLEQGVIIKKDLWYLDGAVTLRDNRKLDAELWKEALL